jgi:hypothetical protein
MPSIDLEKRKILSVLTKWTYPRRTTEFWNFLEGALLKLGFDNRWVSWIMKWVRSVKFSVLINGQSTETFTPTRGLRQGDPLSPYLFLFVAESLTKLIAKAIQDKNLQEFKICRTSPGISHLMFADDCLLFFRASKDQAIAINNVVASFERGPGQLLSAEKCSLLFSDNCPETIQQEVRHTLDVSREAFEDKYLDYPTPKGQMKKGKFQPSKERLSKKLNNWVEKLMSTGAKDELMKFVA